MPAFPSRAAILLAGFLAACAGTPPPPTLTLAGAQCAAAPDLALAKPLAFAGKSLTQDIELAATGPCLRDEDGRNRLYALLRLPDETAGAFTAAVASPARGNVVFAPRISLLDAQGGVVRELSEDSLTFRGGALTGLLRPHRGERYLLVSSNPDAVGRNFSRTAASVNVSTISVGMAFAQLHSGADTTSNYTYSHTGKIVVSIDPIQP